MIWGGLPSFFGLGSRMAQGMARFEVDWFGGWKIIIFQLFGFCCNRNNKELILTTVIKTIINYCNESKMKIFHHHDNIS